MFARVAVFLVVLFMLVTAVAVAGDLWLDVWDLPGVLCFENHCE